MRSVPAMDLSAPPTPWQPLLTRDEVEHHSPARKLGVTLSKEIWAKIGLFDLIKRAGAQLNVGDFCVFMAAFYLNVFFSKCYPPNEQSRVAAACACLVLATKSTDALAAPHLPQVLKAFQKVHKDWRDPGVFAAAENVVIDAERELLLHLRFQLQVSTLQTFFTAMSDNAELLTSMVDEKALRPGADVARWLREATTRPMRDVLKSTLPLQYPPEVLGAAVVRLGQLQLEKDGKLTASAVMAIGDQEWWEVARLGQEQIEDIKAQLALVLRAATSQGNA